MTRVILYYAHPGQRFSHSNKAMWDEAKKVDGITRVDLYADYPRFNIDIEREQQRLLDHDLIVLQSPLFWYSTPSLVKEWIDLTLEHGFAYGHEGTQLKGKTLLMALTAAGPHDAYSEEGYQRYPLRTFLTPFEQTARLCGMGFASPYVLFGSLRAVEDRRIPPHAEGYRRLLEAYRDDRVDEAAASKLDVVEAEHVNALIKDQSSHG
ncbi:MAG: NAD(P)H-dependent oxidoreductase [Pseudomonadota bacterium]